MEWVQNVPANDSYRTVAHQVGALEAEALISPLMDLIFGTYVCPQHEPAALGLASDPMPQNYWAQLLYPFLPRRAWPKLDRWFGRREALAPARSPAAAAAQNAG